MRGLLFDLDGVLVDSEEAYRAAWTAWAGHYALTAADFPADIHGLRPHDVVLAVIAAARPHADPQEAVARYDAAFDRPAREHTVAMPGAVELTRALAAQGRAWAIVSSTHRRHLDLMIDAAGLAVPAVVISGDDIARGKPAPDGFLLGAQRLGLAPAACTVVEDAPPGVAAAVAAGMDCVAVATTHAPGDLAAAGAVFGSLLSASDHLLELTGSPPL